MLCEVICVKEFATYGGMDAANPLKSKPLMDSTSSVTDRRILLPTVQRLTHALTKEHDTVVVMGSIRALSNQRFLLATIYRADLVQHSVKGEMLTWLRHKMVLFIFQNLQRAHFLTPSVWLSALQIRTVAYRCISDLTNLKCSTMVFRVWSSNYNASHSSRIQCRILSSILFMIIAGTNQSP